MYVIFRYNKNDVLGGVEFKILSIVKNLVHHDIPVLILINETNTKFSYCLDMIDGVHVNVVDSRFKAFLQLRNLITQKGVMVMQAHQFYDSVMIRVCKAMSSRKFHHLFRVHTHLDGYIVGYKKKVLKFVDQVTSVYVDSIIPLSNAQLRNEFQGIHDRQKLKVLYNGIAGYPSEPLRKIEKRFLIVGDIQSRKNQAETVKALLSLPYDVRIDIAGNIKELGEWNRLKEHIDSEKGIIYHGMCDTNKLKQLYNETTFVVLASKAEGLPTTLLECFSAGRIAIFSDAGSTREVLFDNFNGFLLSQICQENIVTKIQSIFEFDDKVLLDISKRSLESFDDRFKEGVMVDYFRNLYENLNS
jgi:hypothetical protein